MSVTIAKPQIEIDAAIKELIQHEVERCTIVHCRLFTPEPTAVRIWPTTFLIEDKGRKVKLIKAFNISLAPDWTQHFVFNDFIRFTLVFEGLTKNCKAFHLLEDITEPFAFYSKQISRNSSDVYFAEIFC
jgi:hypothetical protein